MRGGGENSAAALPTQGRVAGMRGKEDGAVLSSSHRKNKRVNSGRRRAVLGLSSASQRAHAHCFSIAFSMVSISSSSTPSLSTSDRSCW